MAAVCLVTISACGNSFGTEQLSTAESTAINTTSLSYHIPMFSDVPEGVWYEEAVMYCIKNGILSQISDTIFSPSDLMTRAMLAANLYRMSDSPAVNNVPTFSDISAGSWCVDDAVTHEQMATILWRYAGSSSSEKIVEFADTSSISEWALLAVSWAKSKGIISGKANNHFAPKDNITCAEAAIMLYRWQNSSENNKKETATKTLVAYFSATDTTQTLAEAADISGADLYENVPEQPYTQEDLTYIWHGQALKIISTF